jgi:hypothetical protein
VSAHGIDGVNPVRPSIACDPEVPKLPDTPDALNGCLGDLSPNGAAGMISTTISRYLILEKIGGLAF